jgi:hypothetical protein
VRDPRGGGRSSARLTAPTVAAGAVARKWLHERHGTTFRGCMTHVGELAIGFEDWAHVPNNPFFAPVADVSAIEDYMNALRKAGDSCGARLRVTAQHVPARAPPAAASWCRSRHCQRATSPTSASSIPTCRCGSKSWVSACSPSAC